MDDKKFKSICKMVKETELDRAIEFYVDEDSGFVGKDHKSSLERKFDALSKEEQKEFGFEIDDQQSEAEANK